MSSQFQINFVILAGGRGERMKSQIPKPLHIVGSESMLQRVIEAAKEFGPEKVIVVYGHRRVKEEAGRLGCDTAFQREPLGTADALKSALGKCSENADILVTCADIPLVPVSVYRRLAEKHAEEGNYMTLLTSRVSRPSGYGRVIEQTGGVKKIVEEKEATAAEKKINLINAGAYCIKPDNLKEYLDRIKKSPVKKEYYLTDLVEIAACGGEKIGNFECGSRYVIGVNTPQALKEARREAAET